MCEPRRRARDDETWAGLTAPVTRLRDDGTIECYIIDVECWIEGERAKPKHSPELDARPDVRAWEPTCIDPDGVPVLVLG